MGRIKGIKGLTSGRPKKPWSMLLEKQHAEPATDDDRRRVAKSLGMRDCRKVPNGMTFGELLAWQTNKMAISGMDNAMNAVMDRVSPKPKRVEVVVDNVNSRAPVSAEDEPGAEEAAAYMDEL